MPPNKTDRSSVDLSLYDLCFDVVASWVNKYIEEKQDLHGIDKFDDYVQQVTTRLTRRIEPGDPLPDIPEF
jgi:hypothetical protein